MRYIQLGCLMMISTCAYAQTYAQTEKGIVLKDSISAESNHIIDSQKPFEMAKDSIDIKPDLTLPYMPVFPNSGMSEFGNYAPWIYHSIHLHPERLRYSDGVAAG